MQVRKLKSFGIRKVGSTIRTGGQKVRVVKQNIKDDLTTSTMYEEEEKEEPSKRKSHGMKMRDVSENLFEYKKGKSQERYQYQNDINSFLDEKVYVSKRQKEKEKGKTSGRPGQESRQSAGRNSTNPAELFQVAGQGYKNSAAVKGAAKGAAKEATKGTAKAGGTAAAGAATGGIAFGAVVIDKAAELTKQKAKRIKANLEASVEGEQQRSKKETAKQREKSIQESAGEKENKKGSGILGGGTFLILMGICSFFFIFVILFGAILASSFEETPETNEGYRIVEVAEQEEAEAGFNIGGEKYKRWYGMNDNWCAMFVSWCADQCGYIDDGIMPRTASVAAMKQWYMERNLYQAQESGYEPKPGDIIIFGNGKSHTGIVVEYNPNSKELTTIEGNTGRSETTPYHKGSLVKRKRYPLNYSYIVGYGTPEYPAEDETEIPEDGIDE